MSTIEEEIKTDLDSKEELTDNNKKKWWKKSGPKKKKPDAIPIHKLFRFATKLELFMIFIATICSIGTGALMPISIIFMGDILGKMALSLNNLDQLLETCLPLIYLFAYIATATLIASYIANCFWIITGENQARRIKREYMHAVMHQEMAWFDKAEEGSLVTRLSGDIQIIQDGISEKFGLFIMCIAQFITGFVVAFVKGWQLAVVMIVCIPAMSTAGGLMGYFITKYTKKSQDEYAEAGKVAEQAFSGIRTVFSFSLQDRFSELYEKKLDRAYSAGVQRGIATALGLGTFFFVIFSTYGLSLWYGSRLIHQGKLDGSVVLISFYSMMIGAVSLLELPPNVTAVSSAAGAAFNIFETIDRKPEIDKRDIVGKQTIQDLKGSIHFDHVKFNYPTRPELAILKDFHLTIQPGQTVAIVGPSGSGKSTTIQLLQRLYDPNEGFITLDGINTKDLNLSWLRQQFGVVSQEPVLFNMTIRQNLLLGVLDESQVTEEDLVRACTEANCHSFISKLPNGYDTYTGEQGSMLSGGQKQRIAIARAILGNPSILLLDEATSALDTQSERLVQKALDNASTKRTTIVIAHRLSTIRNADMIVVLNQGVIAETGTHQELVELGGIYADLVKKQEIATDEKHRNTKYEKEHVENSMDEDEKLLKKLNDLKLSNKEANEYAGLDAFEIKILKEKQENDRLKKQPAPIKRVFSQMKPELPIIMLGLCGCVIGGSIFPVFNLFFSRIITTINLPNTDLNPPPFQGVNLDAFLFVVLGFGAFVGFSLQISCFEIAGERYTRRLRAQVFTAYLKQETGFFDDDDNQVGALTTKLAVDAKNVNEMITKCWGDIIQAVTTAVASLAIAFAYSWIITLIILLVTPFVVAATAYDVKVHQGYEDNTKTASAESGEVAGEAIKEIRTVTSLNQQPYFEERYLRANKRAHQLAIRRAYLSSISYALSRGLLAYVNAIGFYAGIRLLIDNKVTYVGMFTSMMAVMVAAQGVGHNSQFPATFAKAKVSANAIFEIIDRQSKVDPDLEGIEPVKNSLRGKVDYNQIEFYYPSRPNIPIFSGNFNLHAESGKTVALVGPSGCGKSTTIGILERWYNTTSGEVTLDDNKIESFTLRNLRSHMSHVGQEPILFDLSIGDNIRFGIDPTAHEDEVTEQEVIDACQSANIHEFITSLPEGYNTRVGDKGSQLSGGQKQRIAIARALIRKPTVLLLDEATAALDSESEKVVQEALDNIIEKGGRTTITIAHRLSTIQNADLICVVNEGEIVEKGTHWELLALNGIYSALVREQSLAT